MAERRITCRQCCAYDREERRCRVGKTNPPHKHVAFTVAELLGVRALCIHNPYREPLIERMYFPDRPRRMALSTSHSARPIAVEIMED